MLSSVFGVTLGNLVGQYLFLTLGLITVPGRAQGLTTAAIVKRATPAIVLIKGTSNNSPSFGSGFLVSSDGKIITAFHVIENFENLTVRLANGETYDSKIVLGFDKKKDIAIIKIAGFDLPFLELGNSNKIAQGEPVVLLGNPEGLQGSITAGIISAVRDSPDGAFKVIQTDAAASPGNSGGPLLNSSGQVIGILDYKMEGAENLNFAIPINYARGILKDAVTPITLADMRRQVGGTNSTSSITTSTGTNTRFVTSEKVITRLTIDQLKTIVRATSYPIIEQDKPDDKYLMVMMNNLKIAVLLNNNVQISFHLFLKDKLSYEKLNSWNANTKYTYAYADPVTGESNLVMDLWIGAGVTESTIESYIVTFKSQVTEFIKLFN